MTATEQKKAKKRMAFWLLWLLFPQSLSRLLPTELRQILTPPEGTFPPGWTGPATIPGYDPSQGPAPPLYVDPFSPGPRPPVTSLVAPSVYEVTIDIVAGIYMFKAGNSWAAVHDSISADIIDTTGNSWWYLSDSSREGTDYEMSRTIMVLDLSSIPTGAVINWANIYTYNGGEDTLTVSLDTASGAAGNLASDYSKADGIPTGEQAVYTDDAEFQLSDEHAAYLTTCVGGSAKIIFREYLYDTQNVNPANHTHRRKAAYSWTREEPELRPYAVINYSL